MNRHCAHCQAELPPDVPTGRCPACLLRVGLGEEFEGEDTDLPNAEGKAFDQIGDYELLSEIARGGMGVVFRARQRQLNRIVALKLILSGQFASKQEVLRFRAEAENAAQLRHPNIVAVYETGEADGRQYFSMEYVEGQDLATAVREGPLPPRQAARYARIVAEAIHYAHGQGILHRDLKPSNVLIDADDQPRITDFGLAKRLRGEFGLTVTGQFLGSPNFMPPEQISGKRSELGPAGDVYGVGAILYHLLTSRPPFQGTALEDVLRQVHEQEPVAPSLLNASVSRDLETICLKCLEKDPSKRYASARELACELERFLKDEPIKARPIGKPEKLWRWCRRKPALASLAAALTAVTITGLSAVLWQWNRATETARHLRERVYASDLNLAARALHEKDLGHARQLLKQHLPQPQEEDLRGFEWRYLWQRCQGDEIDTIPAHDAEVVGLSVAPNGEWLVTAGFDRNVKLWDLRSRKPRMLLKTYSQRSPLLTPLISPDGSLLVAGDPWNLHAWETVGWREIKAIPSAGIPLAFLEDGRALACAGGDPNQPELRIWDTTRWTYEIRATNFQGFAASPEGHWFAIAKGNPIGTNQGIELWDGLWRPAGSLAVEAGSLDKIYAMTFSPDGGTFAVGYLLGRIDIWDTANRHLLTNFQAHAKFAGALEFSPDGRLLASASGTDQSIVLWNTTTWQKEKELLGHENGIWGLAWTPDGRELLSASRDHTVKFWQASSPLVDNIPTGAMDIAGFLPDNHTVILFDSRRLIAWDLREQRERISHAMPSGKSATAGALSAAATVVIGFRDGTMEWRDLSAWTLRRSWTATTNAVFSVRLAPGGEEAASTSLYFPGQASLAGALGIWDLARGQSSATILQQIGTSATSVAYSHDGRLLAVARPDNSILLWDRKRRRVRLCLQGHSWDVSALAFSPDDRILASDSWDTTLRLWNVETGELLSTLAGGSGYLSFSPDGRTLAVAPMNPPVRLIHVPSRQEIMTLPWNGAFAGDPFFSPDGSVLAMGSFEFKMPVGTGNDHLHIWRAEKP